MIRAFALIAVTLATSTLVGTYLTSPSHAQSADACPCFTTAEILSTCPRPDAEHTEYFDTGSDGKSLHLKCFATQNYSPGSIHFETGPGGDGVQAHCGRQSVEVPPYGSGGQFPPVSAAQYASCKATLEDAAGKLKLQLVMDQFSKKDVLTATYQGFLKARATAKSWGDLLPFMSSKSAKEVQDMSAEEREMIFEISQMVGASQGETEVIVEAIDENQAVVVGEYCSEDKKWAQHIVWHVVEGGTWKVRKESHDISSDPCDDQQDNSQNAPQNAPQDAPMNEMACTNEEMNKGDARVDQLLNGFPANQRDQLSNDMMNSVFDNLGNEFCSQDENVCKCNDEAIRFLESR